MRNLIEKDSLDVALSDARLQMMQCMKTWSIMCLKEKNPVEKERLLKLINDYGKVCKEIKKNINN